ncbi:MAG: L,D-transpeptidase/peptidoglycan binding protein [Lachnospiraceae bacterium]|nr:L,D-transpeptidase/peptidoglycan binding protein [Lachnospiraceae bacterium]
MKKLLSGKIKWIAVLSLFLIACLAGCGQEKETGDAPDTEEETGPVGDAMSFGETESEDSSGGSVFSDPAELPLADRIASMKITIPFGDETETLDGTTLTGWIETSADGRVSVDEEKAKQYVADLASKHDTFGRNRSFTTHDGKQITVSGGDYGYWMDRVSTRQELIAMILTGESGEFNPVYYSTASSYDADAIGDTYVEVNIGAQHLWVYKNGEVVNETDFVSGGLFKGNSTPEGTYAITYKERDSTLVGEGYESSVKYWMPFNGNIGLHDASWRDEFGGHIYYFKGSHGCLNLPTAKAAEIYDQVEKGEPVIVYGSITKEAAAENLTIEDKVTAVQKGYLPMSTDVATYIIEQQGLDHDTAAALAAAGQEAADTGDQEEPQQTETEDHEEEEDQEQSEE